MAEDEKYWGENGQSPNGDGFESVQLAERRPEPVVPDTRDLGGPAMPLWSARSSYNFVLPEYVPDLIGKQAVRTYDKMRRSSAHVRAALAMVKAPILTAGWYIKPASDNPIDREAAQFADNNLFHGMRRSWQSFLREALCFLDFGFYPFEKEWVMDTWQPQPTDDQPRPRSRPVARLLDLAPRHPYYIFGWQRDLTGMVTDFWYGSYQVELPLSKLALFTLDSEADDPTGKSLLRSAYMHWFYLMNLYKVDAMQKERHGIGIPDIQLPVGHSKEDKTTADELGRNLRANEEAHIVRPPNWSVGFVELKGQPINVLASAEHHGKMILENVLGQFIDQGGGTRGGGASSSSRSGGAAAIMYESFFQSTLYFLDYMASVINEQVIKPLVAYNYDVTAYPEIRARQIDEAKLRALSVALRNAVISQVVTPDPELEVFVRDQWMLPDASPDALARTVEDRAAQTKAANSVAFEEGE